MKNLKLILIILTTVTLLSSCASNYRTISYNKLSFQEKQWVGDFEIEYAYDALYANKNRRYAKNEKKNNHTLIALRVKNVGSSDLIFDLNQFDIITQNDTIFPIPTHIYLNQTSQKFYKYLIYVPFLFSAEYSNNNRNGQVQSLGLNPITTVLMASNIIFQLIHNGTFQNNVNTMQPYEKNIAVGEIKYFLVPIPENDYLKLEFQLKNL
jgi:hypothetical protein